MERDMKQKEMTDIQNRLSVQKGEITFLTDEEVEAMMKDAYWTYKGESEHSGIGNTDTIKEDLHFVE